MTPYVILVAATVMFDYVHPHEMVCRTGGDCENHWTYTRPEYPPTHWENISVELWGEYVCGNKFCHPSDRLPLTEVCGSPGHGEFVFTGSQIILSPDDAALYPQIYTKANLLPGDGKNTTSHPPVCGIS